MDSESQDPKFPEQPGEPNSEVEPGFPNEAQPQLPPETPANPPESGDYISEIRQSLVSEETSRTKRGTGSLIRRITGSLRRVTGPLRNTDKLTGEKETAAPEPSPAGMTNQQPIDKLESESEQAVTDDLLTGRLGTTQAPETAPGADDNLPAGEPGGEPTQAIPDDFLAGRLGVEPGEAANRFFTRPLESEPEPETDDNILTGKLDFPTDSDVPDSLLTDRFGRTAMDEAQPISRAEIWDDLRDSGGEAGELLEMEEEPTLGSAPITDDESISLLESGAIAAEEEQAEGDEPDWMREIRAETRDDGQDAATSRETGSETWPESEPPSTEQPSARGATNPLRNFITGILGRSKEKESQPDDTAVSDELVSNRLERSLGTEAKEAPRIGIGEDEIFDGLLGDGAFQATSESGLDEPFAVAFQETPITDDSSLLDTLSAQEKGDFFDGLEVNFGNVGEMEPSDDINGYELYPEDQAMLWGSDPSASEATAPEIPITPEDIWGNQNDVLGYGSELRREIWGEAAEPETSNQGFFPPVETGGARSDEYTAAYAEDEDFQPGMAGELEGEPGAGESDASDGSASVQDLRAIALEDYEEGEFSYSDYEYKIDWGDEEQAIPIEAETETEKAESEQAKLWAEDAEEDTRKALSTDWKSWFANRKTSQKILLVEAAVVVIAMLIAVPYFIFMMIRGPMIPVVQSQQTGLPYPTGLTLPGGWYFPLEGSTLSNGKWQPKTSEWLEGSELRRVVALPWNPQTEAVIKTFQVGDGVELYLSNNDTLKYQVTSIERLAVNNTQVYSDRNPSLAIILYQEKDPTRWVIICKP